MFSLTSSPFLSWFSLLCLLYDKMITEISKTSLIECSHCVFFCVVCVFVFHFLQNSSSLFIACVSSAIIRLFSSNLCFISCFFYLLAYTIIQRKSETVDFNDFTFCNFYLLACLLSVAYKRCSLFTTIATDLEFLQYDFYFQFYFFCFKLR